MGWIRTSTKQPEPPVLERSVLEEYLDQLVWELNFRSLCESEPGETVLWVQDITLTGYDTERRCKRSIFARARAWLRRLFKRKR